MSKKSKPGDGGQNQGVKGGGLYGAHFIAGVEEENPSLLKGFLSLARSTRRSK